MTDSADAAHKRPDRLPAWVALVIFSIVVLAAMNSRGVTTGAEKWVIALSSLSLTFSLLAIVAYLVPHMRMAFIGELPESCLAAFLLMLWICGLPVIMAPGRTIAVAIAPENGLSYVWNANLFFFSWAAFLDICFICGSLVTEKHAAAQEALSTLASDAKLGKWFMLIVTSLIVMASAAQFQTSECSGDVVSQTCTSNKYAISLGAIAFVFGLAVSVLAYLNSLNIFVETGTAFLLFVMYTAGVGVITFEFGSGVTIGNLYFSTWGGFMIATFLLVDCYQGVMLTHEPTAAMIPHNLSESSKQDSIPVEPIPEEDDI